MSVSQPPLYPISVNPNAWNLGSRQSSQSVHERRQNKKRRLEAKGLRKQKDSNEKENDAPYTPFFVPEEILLDNDNGSGALKHDNQSQSLLLSILPTELLLLIVEHLSIPYFQVCLGLTCKRVATILSQNRIRISPWRGYLDKEGLYRLLTQPERQFSNNSYHHSNRSIPKQRHLSLDNLSITEPKHSPPLLSPSPTTSSITTPTATPYIPLTLRLCRACFRHIPRSPTYWQSRMSTNPAYDLPTVNWFDITNFFDEGYRNCGQHKCPDCCVRGYLAFMSEGAYERAVREDRRDEEVGVLEGDGGEGGGRRVCPGLVGRLGRP